MVPDSSRINVKSAEFSISARKYASPCGPDAVVPIASSIAVRSRLAEFRRWRSDSLSSRELNAASVAISASPNPVCRGRSLSCNPACPSSDTRPIAGTPVKSHRL
jgi:hypothetical protein